MPLMHAYITQVCDSPDACVPAEASMVHRRAHAAAPDPYLNAVDSLQSIPPYHQPDSPKATLVEHELERLEIDLRFLQNHLLRLIRAIRDINFYARFIGA